MSSPTDTYTVSHAIDALGFGSYQILLSFIVGMAYIADAMEMMLLSVLAPALHCHWQITQLQQASLTTVVFLGKFVLNAVPRRHRLCFDFAKQNSARNSNSFIGSKQRENQHNFVIVNI